MADIIRTEELGRCFRTTGGEFWALKNISIQVPEGRLTILKGRSGSGKTTLMNILGALDRPTSGRVFFAEQDITRLDERRSARLRRTQIGFVFQSVALIPMMTALENVEYALRMADEPTAELDTNTGLQVVKIFKELCEREGVTIVMTTHDTGLMEIGDCVYELQDGEVISHG